MSWRDPSRRAALALLAASALAGCGFQPLHGTGGGDSLDGRVQLALPDGRLGHAMRDVLERRFGLPGPGADWRLTARLDLSREGLAITEDSAITRYVLRAEAPWALEGPEGEALRGRARAMSAYSADGSLYASRAARRDAEARVAAELAERISTEVAARLATGGIPKAE